MAPCSIESFGNAPIQADPRGEPVQVQFQRTNRFLQRLFKRPPDRHHLADRFHLRGQGGIGAFEFLKCKSRDFDHDIVDRRFERGFGHTGDVVGDFVQRVPHGELRRNLRDGKSGRFRRQRRTPRHARIHFDDDHVAVVGIDAELNVRTAGIDADLPDDANRRIPHALIFFVRQRHGRRNRDAVARMHAHRIQIFDRTDNDDIVLEIPHDLKFVFFPADQGLFDQDLADRTHGQAPIRLIFRTLPDCRRCCRRCRPS